MDSASVALAIAIASLAVAGLAVGLAVAQARRFGRYRRSFGMRMRRAGEATRPPIPADASGIGEEVAALHESLLGAVQRVGLVRFDAFEDMGGQLSFALAMLDADGTGVVLSSINGRRETRVYAKAIERGESAVAITDEEREAVRRAMGGVRL